MVHTKQLKLAHGQQFMVTSGHDLATQTAVEMLQAGASVADAALAGAAVLSVALPNACGLGGDAFMMVHNSKTGRTEVLNASGQSPAQATAERFPAGIPERGALSCNVPGMIAGWQALHQRYGQLPWADVLAPAIHIARKGFEVSRIYAQSAQLYEKLLNPASRKLFFINDRPPRAGEHITQPVVADTLSTIAQSGASAFYQGDIGASIAKAVQAANGIIQPDDLRCYQPQWTEPIATQYAGHTVLTPAPNSFGLYLLLQLMHLEQQQHTPGTNQTEAQRLIRLIKAAQASFVVGNRAVADPDPQYGAEPAATLLGVEGQRRLQQAVNGRPGNLGGTAIINVCDREGNAVTIIQSVFLVFGSGISDEHTGVLLNNRLFGFTTTAGHPNQIGPNKRPAHTLSPAMVTKDGQLELLIATPGGPGQTLTIAQVLQALYEQHQDIETAINQPRWAMDIHGNPIYEAAFHPEVVAAIKEAIPDFQPGAPGSPYFGSVKTIQRNRNGKLVGAVDSRRDATTRGL